MFGFEALAAFTHHVETAFDQVRKGDMAPTRELIAVALAAKDQMRILIEQPEKVDTATCDAILGDLERFMKAPVVANQAPAEVAWRIRFRLPADAMATGTNPLLLLDELRALGPASVTVLTGGCSAARSDRSDSVLSVLGGDAADGASARDDRAGVPVRPRRHGT